MSRSGGRTTVARSSASSRRCELERRARAPRRGAAPSPSRVSGSARSVVHSAAAAAPAREHSRLISPRCSSVGREVRVRRVVGVEAPDAGIAEQHAAAAVGLQAVLVRVDHDRVARARSRANGAAADAGLAAVGEQREEAAVGGVDVQPRAVLGAQAGDRADGVDRAEAGRAQRRARPCRRRRAAQPRFERVEVDAAVARPGRPSHGARRARRTCARACSGRSRRRRSRVRDAARAPPTAPRGWRSCPMRSGARGAASKPNIAASSRDRLPLHRRGGRAAVERVVVRVEQHRRRRTPPTRPRCGGLSICPA